MGEFRVLGTWHAGVAMILLAMGLQHLCPALCHAETDGALPELIAKDGLLLFVSEAKLQRDWEDGSFQSYSRTFPRSELLIEELMGKLNAAPSAPAATECERAIPLAWTDDDQLGSRDVRVRSINSSLSLIGLVEEISGGWSGGYAAPSKLIRVRVVKLLQDANAHVASGGSFYLRYPGSSISVGGRTLCVKAGHWPDLVVGDRVLFVGSWAWMDGNLAHPFDVVKIVDGELQLKVPSPVWFQDPTSLSEEDLVRWWASIRTRRE